MQVANAATSNSPPFTLQPRPPGFAELASVFSLPSVTTVTSCSPGLLLSRASTLMLLASVMTISGRTTIPKPMLERHHLAAVDTVHLVHILAIHSNQFQAHGGSLGFRGRGLVESALARSRNRHHWVPKSPGTLHVLRVNWVETSPL